MNMQIGKGYAAAEQLAELRRFAEEVLARTGGAVVPPEQSDERTPVRKSPGAFGYAPMAERIYEARGLRADFFDEDLFGEPAWDILLDLFMQTHRGRQVSVTSACIASRVPATTGLRWVGLLMNRGMIERVPDPVDRRRAFLQLSQTALLKLSGYFKALDERGL